MGPGRDTLESAALGRCATGVFACVGYAVGLIRAAAFWGTIFLPLVIVAGLVTDLVTSVPYRLGLLIGLNVLCILLGRSYRTGE